MRLVHRVQEIRFSLNWLDHLPLDSNPLYPEILCTHVCGLILPPLRECDQNWVPIITIHALFVPDLVEIGPNINWTLDQKLPKWLKTELWQTISKSRHNNEKINDKITKSKISSQILSHFVQYLSNAFLKLVHVYIHM